MHVALPDWLAFVLFIALTLSITIYVLALSVHFPAEHRRSSLRGGGGYVLWGTAFIAIAAAVVALYFAWTALPGYFAVLGGGAAILIAPTLLKPLPDRLIDDRGGLLLFAGVAALLALASLLTAVSP